MIHHPGALYAAVVVLVDIYVGMSDVNSLSGLDVTRLSSDISPKGRATVANEPLREPSRVGALDTSVSAQKPRAELEILNILPSAETRPGNSSGERLSNI